MTRGTILAFSPGLWNWTEFTGSPRYHLWTLAGLGWKVVFVEPPKKFTLGSTLRSAPDRPFHVLSPAAVPPFAVRHIPGPQVGSLWRSLVARRLAQQGIAACRRLSLSPDHYWFGAPWHSAIARYLPHGPRRLFHVYDELTKTPAFSPMQQQLLSAWEEEMCACSDLVLCSSQPQQNARTHHGEKVRLLENAVRDDFLQLPALECPGPERSILDALRQKTRPRVVYTGVADHRLDPALFEAILRIDRVGSLSFLGIATDDFRRAFHPSRPDAVSFFGSIGYSAIPALLAEADLAVIAHRRTPFTDAMFPEKLNEYLSSGKPVVSVDMSEVCRVAAESRLSGAVYTASNGEEFATAVHRALEENSPELEAERRRLAGERTWSRMGGKLDQWLLEMQVE